MTLNDKLTDVKKYIVDIYIKLRETNDDTPTSLRLERFSDFIIPCEDGSGSNSLKFEMNYIPEEIMIPVINFTGTVNWGDGSKEDYESATNITHSVDETIYGNPIISLEGEADGLNTEDIRMSDNNYEAINGFAFNIRGIVFNNGFKIKSMDGFAGKMTRVKRIEGFPNTDSFKGMFRGGTLEDLYINGLLQKGMYEGASFINPIKFGEEADVINTNAFKDAEFKQGFEFSDSIKYIGDNAFKNASFKGIMYNPTVTLIIPNNTIIGNNAFDNINDYDLIYFGEGCTIGDEAFRYVDFSTLQIEEGTRLGKGVFANANIGALISYGDIEEIPERTFENATFTNGNAMLLIPSTIKKISPRAFANSDFKQITIPKSVEVAEDAFEGISKDKIIYED